MNKATRIKAFFTSFTIKIFIWFWLITIVSIMSTRFISQQLSSEGFNKVVSHPTLHNDLRKLHSTAKRIELKNPNSVEEFIAMRQKRSAKFPFNIWFKRLDGSPKILSLFPLPKKHQKALMNHLNKQQFTQPHTTVFRHTKLIGPVKIKINKHSYQLFISTRQHKRDIRQIVQELPYWARITIPAFISFILCLLLAHSFSKPVRIIKKATTKLGQGDFTTRVEGLTQRSDELGQLANSFNKMAEQLQRNQSAQQRLLGDVSHELRSPMTRLAMALGLAQEDSTTEQARQQYLQRCQREIERLDQMISDVLALSRLENTIQTAESKQINITTLLQNIINDEQFVADEKAIKIQMNTASEITTLADSALLVSAISNVLTNAVKYSPENSTIAVSLSSHSDEITIVISDNGDGVPEQALTQLFSPFYRVNLARDRNTGGTGLGLAIAKQAVIAHKGKIFAKNNATKGLSVTIQLPYL